MNSKYSTNLFEALHKVPKPVQFQVDLVEDPYNLILRVYQEDILRLTERDRKLVMEYLLELRNIINKSGAKGVIQPVEGWPPV